MVQNISNQTASSYGSVQKVGVNENGRAVYQLTDGGGQISGKISIAQKDCDVFEKSYRDIMESAPKLQKYAEKHSDPEYMKKMRSASRWIIGICTAAGALIPMIKTKGSTLKQVLLTSAGTIAGLTTGFGISLAVTTPPGSMKFAKATKNLSKIDIQPEN